MAAALPSISDDAPPGVAAPPTMSSTGSAYLIAPADCALLSVTVTTPWPKRVCDGLGLALGLDDALALAEGLGLVLGFGFSVLPFWFLTSVAALMVSALRLAGSGR